MKNPWEIIVEIESDNGKLFKEAVINREAKAGNDVFFKGLLYGLDKFDTFGVKKVPSREENIYDSIEDRSYSEEDFSASFYTLCDNLISRKLTGNSALDSIERLKDQCHPDRWNNWYRRIILKDFKAGFSETTVNKAVKKTKSEYIIRTFSCMLAEDTKGDESVLKGKKLIQSKLDGARCIVFVYKNGNVIMMSRNGKEILNFPQICDQFSKIAYDLDQDYVFDGEVMSANFQDLMKQFRRKTDVQTDDAVLHLFDYVTLDEFKKGIGTIRQETRSESLLKFIDKYSKQLPSVRALEYEIVDMDTEEGQNRFKEINAFAIANKYEGIMAKDLDAFYECDRVKSWMKMKPTITLDMTIEGVKEGAPETKYVGMMGAVDVVAFYEGNLVEASVGGGWSDKERKDIWDAYQEDPTLVIGRIVEVKADAVTKNQDGKYSLRFPRKFRFRDSVENPGVKI